MFYSEYEVMYRLENSHWWFVAKKKYLKIILDYHFKKKGGKILDIGCGTGGMIDLFKNYGQVYGMDRHGAACEYSHQRNKCPLLKGDANQLPFKKGTFSLVALLDVLYHQHILNDENILDQIHGLLAPDGLVLITDSAFEFLKSTHDIAVMARHRYTLKELRAKLKSSHFLIVRSTYLYFIIFPVVVLSRLVGKLALLFLKPTIHSDLKKTNPYLNKFLALLLSLEGNLLKYFSFPWGSSLLILGKKENP
jgi:SAM-dependent methyltransferase